MDDFTDYPAGNLSNDGTGLAFVDLPALFGEELARLPVVLRLLLENAIRHLRGAERRTAVDAIFGWLVNGSSDAEIAFQPGRVLMHDTTSTPALVDIAAMRDTLAEAGIDPAVLNPEVPVDVSVDHSLAVEAYARRDAPEINLRHEIRRNQERYTFLRWAARALSRLAIHPPGTGIMHTINLEQLATVVSTEHRAGVTWAVPDTMIGTDSHTPMINGLGVLGWGVGGLEAQTVMFGMPTLLRIPDVIGVRLIGALRPGVLATDLALVVTQRLRAIGVSGEFVEFFGPGVPTLTVGERSVVANMAPEYGATTGYFPIDGQVLDYLRATGRAEDAIALVRIYAGRAGLWFDPECSPRFSRVVEIDLSSVGMHVAGPRRPQDLLALDEAASVLTSLGSGSAGGRGDMPRFPIAVAAITSCTNTSDPSLLIAAGLVARNASRLGLRIPHWVKTSLSPGSPAAASYLQRAGLIDALADVGFDIVGYGCATCIGNTGPLPGVISTALSEGSVRPVAVLSGNRNFPGRIHPDLDLGFLMSPPLVIAYALAGDAERDLTREPIQTTSEGRDIRLHDLWPSREEVLAVLRDAVDPADFRRDFRIASDNPSWDALRAPGSPLFPWRSDSTTLRRPPFASLDEGSQLGTYDAYPLLVVGDDVTTDHISPASAIPRDSLVADFLVARGEDRDDLNVFASRRGNWEVMVRAAFHSKSLANLLQPGMPVAHTLHVPTGEVLPIWEAAERYRVAGQAVVLVAGERYGTGSSRDWAAKGQRLLGIRAVLALSFERIHRSNLIGMGILPLRLPPGLDAAALDLKPGDLIRIEASPEIIQPRGDVPVHLVRSNGAAVRIMATAAIETQLEAALLRDGGVIPSILKRTVASRQPGLGAPKADPS